MEGQIIESVIDTTRRLQWEVTKQRFQSSIGETPRYVFYSPVCDVKIGSEISQWHLQIGKIPDGKIGIGLRLLPGDVTLKVEIEGIGVKTEVGYWPCKPLKVFSTSKMLHKIEHFNGKDNDKSRLYIVEAGYKEDFLKLFHKNKITVMATLRFYVDRNDYIEKNEREKNFLVLVRSISDKHELSDFTVVCGERQFKCHRVILASMSTVLEAMLLNSHFVETKENSITIEHSSPDIVEAMLEFMYKGDVPANIVEKAIELVVLADKYDLQVFVMIVLMLARFGNDGHPKQFGSPDDTFLGVGTCVGYAIIVPCVLVTYLLGANLSILELFINLIGAVLFIAVGAVTIAYWKNYTRANSTGMALGILCIVTGIIFLVDFVFAIKNTRFTVVQTRVIA